MSDGVVMHCSGLGLLVECSGKWEEFKKINCVMTNVKHKFLIYLSIYFCLACFGLSISPSSEAGAQFRQ
jgi:hypothetical protein